MKVDPLVDETALGGRTELATIDRRLHVVVDRLATNRVKSSVLKQNIV